MLVRLAAHLDPATILLDTCNWQGSADVLQRAQPLIDRKHSANVCGMGRVLVERRRVDIPRAAAVAAAVMLASAIASPAAAQSNLGDGPLVGFESASVQPSHSSADKLLKVEPRTGNFTATNASLAELVAFAYGVRIDQIVDLPVWTAAPRYDVEGRAPKKVANRDVKLLVEDVRPLVAGLLVDFFSLEAHRVRSPIYYVLEQAAGGIRLRASPDQRAAPGVLAQSGAGIAGQRVSIGSLVAALEPLVGRHVVVLPGTAPARLYDIDFRWDTHERDPQKLAPALEQQLGLKLHAVELELVVVDRATEL